MAVSKKGSRRRYRPNKVESLLMQIGAIVVGVASLYALKTVNELHGTAHVLERCSKCGKFHTVGDCNDTTVLSAESLSTPGGS